ncbi:MAG: tetratricopeptide repeat protein [Treponema sp.]|nr:tetratricopeptide repeat protein [Treponema sp.]
MATQNLPIDDLALPENEPDLPAAEASGPADSAPAVPDTGGLKERSGLSEGQNRAGESPSPPDFDALNSEDLPNFAEAAPDAAGTESAVPAIDDFDFSAFLDTIPDDIPQPEAGEDEEGLNFPDGLLDGFAEEVEAGRSPEEAGDFPDNADFDRLGENDLLSTAEPEGEKSPEAGPEASPGLDTPGLEDLNFPEFDLGEEAFSPEGEALEGAEDLPETPGADSSFPDLAVDDTLFSETPEEETESPADLSPESGLDLPDLDFDLPAPSGPGEDLSFPPMEELGAPPDEPELAGGAETEDVFNEEILPSPEDLVLGNGEGDAFDTFNLEGEAPLAVEPPSEGDAKGDLSNLEEFSLAGIDDVLKGPAAQPGPPSGREKAGAGKTEEIRLSDGDLIRLQNTLASYPLNLRIACEELIAEQTVAPDQLSKLIKLLVRGAAPRETASLAGKILDRTIAIPRGFEKNTGEALEEEQASFSYIFIRKFLPVLRFFLMIALVGLSLIYLIHQFIYTPLRADSIYRLGYERIAAGDYGRANERFNEALRIRRVKDWFYRYAEGFREARQYIYAEEKYDELLRYYPRDKRGILDYAAMETYDLRNYAKADSLLRRNILDYAADDPDALLALGDNSLAWGEYDPSKYEDARESYARLLERYGWTDPVVERMMKYFIRTDNLGEVLPLQRYFMDNSNRKISPASLAELGGYLLDKRTEEAQGVPNVYVEQIEEIRNILLRAVEADPALPEPHYHLARYYNYFNNTDDERMTLETAVGVFDSAREESVKRVQYRIDTQRRYAQVLTNSREFFAAEEQLIKGIGIYEDALSRRLISRSPEFGRLYADLGDLEYFTQDGDLELARENYLRAEQNGWAPPEIQYRIGSVHYQQEQWAPALERFFSVSAAMPLNRRLLYALGNVSYRRGNYFAAQGYYNRLLDLLETERTRFPLLRPNEDAEQSEWAERLMVARNNMGVTLEALTDRTGDNRYRSRALGLYTESARAWDALTRNPNTMLRFGAAALSTPGINLAYLNSRNALYPEQDYEPQIYPQIDKDVLEPSHWEELVPPDIRLSADLSAYR